MPRFLRPWRKGVNSVFAQFFLKYCTIVKRRCVVESPHKRLHIYTFNLFSHRHIFLYYKGPKSGIQDICLLKFYRVYICHLKNNSLAIIIISAKYEKFWNMPRVLTYSTLSQGSSGSVNLLLKYRIGTCNSIHFYTRSSSRRLLRKIFPNSR